MEQIRRKYLLNLFMLAYGETCTIKMTIGKPVRDASIKLNCIVVSAGLF